MFNFLKKNKKELEPFNINKYADKTFYILSPSVNINEFHHDVFYSSKRNEYYTTNIQKARCYIEGEKCTIFERVGVDDVFSCPYATDALCMMEIEKERSIKLENVILANIHASRNNLLKIMQNKKATKANMTDTMQYVVTNLDKLIYVVSEAPDIDDTIF